MTNETASPPFLWNPETGSCGQPNELQGLLPGASASTKPVKAVYFTDPLCLACWGAEPLFGKLKLEYGHALEIEYRMGGLLPNWKSMGGIKPQRLAAHIEKIAQHFDMPMDGKVWGQDPPHSSFPPSIAFKAAEMQDAPLAITFLRRLREKFFVQGKNIAKWEYIVETASEIGLDTDRLSHDYAGKAGESLDADMALARQLGVKGFPTVIFISRAGEQETVQGAQPYHVFERAISDVFPPASKQPVSTDWHSLFDALRSLATKEYAILANRSMAEASAELRALAEEGKIRRHTARAGDLWHMNA